MLINIDKATQKMTVFLDGEQLNAWPVSTGLPGYTTPSGSYMASSMNEIWCSKQWDNAPMPHAVFFTKEGHAIHGTYEVKRLGKPASHGCVRIWPLDLDVPAARKGASGARSRCGDEVSILAALSVLAALASS
jgi:lipoprotein-anchoring transpeptidase ErfK/SrfK